MRDKLIPEEKIITIQEQLSGFIVQQVLDPKGEFYYDGHSHIDKRTPLCPGLAVPVGKPVQKGFPNRDKLSIL